MTANLNERRFFFGNRESRWALSTYHIGTDDDPYMNRWILRTPWFSLRVHHILRSDNADALHDHPMTFYTFLATGGYTEIVAAGITTTRAIYRRMWSIRRVPADKPHRIVVQRPVWTFSIAFKTDNEWGFYPKRYDRAGKIPAKTYMRQNGRSLQ